MPIHLTRRQLLHRAAVTGAFAALSRTALGAELGRTPRLIPWRNWSGGQSCLPAARLAPQTLDELVQVIRRAEGKVRPVGSAHSFSALVPTDGTLVSLAYFNGLLGHDAATLQAEFAAGTPMSLMGAALKDMTSFLVLAFVLGQFIALFNWSGIGSWIAVTGATALEDAGVTGFPVIIGFILLCSLLNLFIISGSSMWTLMAAVFVPMFGLLGFEPAFIQAAFRVGDSATQVMTPLNPYMVVLLTMLRKYEPSAGLGTLMARMLPFVVPFWLVWVAILVVFYVGGLPLGPGVGIMIGD